MHVRSLPTILPQVVVIPVNAPPLEAFGQTAVKRVCVSARYGRPIVLSMQSKNMVVVPVGIMRFIREYGSTYSLSREHEKHGRPI